MSRVVHFEIPADDPERSIKFYESAFGWKFHKWEGPLEYWLITTGSDDQPGINGGLARREDPDISVENVIDVADIDQAVSRIESSGGKIIRPKIAVPGVGWYVYFADTEGNIFGMMERDENAA
jgi:predicted enzyme related to lactoylglutathione lyase